VQSGRCEHWLIPRGLAPRAVAGEIGEVGSTEVMCAAGSAVSAEGVRELSTSLIEAA